MLATVNAKGHPTLRTVALRSFGDELQSTLQVEGDAKAMSALSRTMVFTTDPEYKSLMISSYLPETRDQLRIKGKAHILTSAAFRATHEHLPDYLRNKTDRVNALLQHLYAEQSPVRRASYAFGAPGAPLVEDASHPKHMAEEKKEISDAAWERYLKHPEEAPHVQTCLDRFALLFFEAESCDWTTCFGNPNTRALFTLSEDVTWFSTPLHA